MNPAALARMAALAAAGLAVALGPGPGAAQDRAAGSAVVRTLRDYDGHPREPVDGQGVLTITHDPRSVRDGLGSLHVAPGEPRYWGVTLRNVDARGARALLADIYHTGSKPAWLLVKVEDARSRGRGPVQRVEQRVDVEPGWNRLEVPLREVRTRNGNRPLDLEQPLARIIIDRGGPKDAFCIDHVRLLLDPPASARRFVSQCLRRFRGEDQVDRVRAVHDLARVPETERVPVLLRLLRPAEPAWIVQALVEELGRSEAPGSWELIRKAFERARPPLALRFLELVGGAKLLELREIALRIAADANAPAERRVVALRSAARRGRADLVPIVAKIGPEAPWPVRAAGVHALRLSRSPEAVDVLIRVLEKPGNSRVELDAYEALTDLTGQDYGYELVQWKGWWAQQRERALPPPSPSGEHARGGYATFYGIPVRGSRVVFILDISGSMRDGISSHRARVHIATSDYLKGKRLETRLDLAKEELVHTLERLPPATSYNVGFFNDEVFWLHREFQPARPENVRKTALRVRSMTAEQKTNVYEALRQSLEAGWAREHTGAREGPDTVFLLSDGMPSAGKITRFHHLADWAYQVNLGRFVRINTILVGERGHLLLKRLARESTGRFADVGG